MKRFLFILTVSTLLLSGCEYLFIRPQPDTSPRAVFEEAWSFADQEYSFFPYKQVDWDEVYQRYQPRVNDSMSEVELFDLLAEMLNELRDGHVNLVADFDLSRNWDWYLNSPPNYNYDVLQRNYFRGEERRAGPFIVYDFGDVGYLYYGEFASLPGATLDAILTDFQEHRGLIIDIRNNGGGATSLADQFVGRIIDTTQILGYNRFKNGPGHEDLGPEVPIEVEEIGDTSYLHPIVLLTNRSSYSSADYFTMLLSQLPNVWHMGDTTGGGAGYPANTQLSNGWRLRLSSSVRYDLSGFITEAGIPPDEVVFLDSAELALGRDAMLEAALQHLRQ